MAGAETNDGSYALGRYRLEHRIASGSVGTVFAATDMHVERQVIVKFIDNSTDSLGGWIKEARLALRLKHPNIARCLDVGYDENHGLWALVYERAMGGSLRRALVAKCDFDVDAISDLLRGLASALSYAHQRGVIHRDVKPENVLAATEVGKPPWLLTDFGAGRFLEFGSSADSVVGSLAYMAPEVMSKSSDALCDCFSLGMVGVELETGRIPDRATRSRYVLEHRFSGGVAGVIASMVEALPERRPPSLALVAKILAQGPASNYSVSPSRDAPNWTLNGDKVFRTLSEDEIVSHRLPRAERFLGEDCQGRTLVASHRRIIALELEGPQTLFAHDREFLAWAFDSKACALWAERNGSLVRMSGDGEQREYPQVPSATLSASGERIGACSPNGDAILGRVGAAWVLRCGVHGADTEFIELDGPVYDIARVAERVVVLCGDHRGAHMLDFSPATPSYLGSTEDPVDAIRIEGEDEHVWLVSGASVRTEQLFEAPMTSSARAG